MPEYYDDPADFPEDMPNDLRDYITSLPPAQVHTIQKLFHFLKIVLKYFNYFVEKASLDFL